MTEPTTGAPYDLDLGLTADQEIRRHALAIAVDAIARVPSWRDYQPLETAGQLAEWIRSGWPRDDGNDGPRPEPATADTEEPTTAPEQGGALPVDPSRSRRARLSAPRS